jgi:hypothetical protein
MSSYETRGEAIVAALDELEEGATLTVHRESCRVGPTGICTCQPESWTY